MIREWLRPNGSTVRYDTDAENVEVRDTSNEIVEALHLASDEERAEYLAFYPSASQDEINKRNAINSKMSQALFALRVATADGSITPLEFSIVNPKVQSALMSYRDYQYHHEDVDRLAFLVLSQVSFAYSLLFAQAGGLSRANANATLFLQTSITELQARVDALEAAQ